MSLSKEKLTEYKERLERERKKLIAEVEKYDKPEDFGDDVDDIDSIEAQEAEEFGANLSIAQALRDRLNEIDEALARMQSNAYGICTNCKKPIGEDVLDIVPESALCADCKRATAA